MERKMRFINELTLDKARSWFVDVADTDQNYLAASFPRFVRMLDFARPTLKPNSTILDIGAHWLHQSFLFANDGHQMKCLDVSLTMRNENVWKQAEAMGATLHTTNRLELAHGFDDFADDSIDAVIFTEIIEHLTFNPIILWKAIYRVLKPGGHIYLSTPNSMYHETVQKNLIALLDDARYGIDLKDIFNTGTFGHHWKEFSKPELIEYFKILSPDFEIARMVGLECRPHKDEIWRMKYHLKKDGPNYLNFIPLIEKMDKLGYMPYDNQIFADLHIQAKVHGISIAPPWIPE